MPQGAALASQTPGDFAVVARRAKLLSETRPHALAAWLLEEAMRRGETAAQIGF
ncbi:MULTISPECIES: hypothetical protein [unclassified Novosphingobium]|uniref:hypothetical protein n=1 Tax=unclassified Novosphingobium TaxID=2644732 RepID=UPI00135796FF|nr:MULTISPECIES: hypothetical protein [unclassified Novosphingobium]